MKVKKDYVNFMNVIHCAIGFLVLFSANNSAMNIQSKIMSDDGFGKLGFYSSATNYISCGIACLFASSIIPKLGVKIGFVVGSGVLAL